ncbi:MAG: hypothetical protein U0176_21975 [Bacteroidia bacterium]
MSGPGTISNAALNNSTVTGLVTGSPTILRWTVANPPCANATDDVILTLINTACQNAGPNQSICTSSTTLAGNSALPGTGTWTRLSGTGTILSPNQPNSVVVGLGVGDNYFQWSVTDGICPATTSVVRITVSAPPTASNAGPDQSTCLTTATLAGNTPTIGTGTWTLVSGAGTLVNASFPNASITAWTYARTPY